MAHRLRQADTLDLEIAAARLYVQDRLSTPQIAERLHCSRSNIVLVLTRVGLPRDRRLLWSF